MARRKLPQEEEGVGFVMTPMIDIVFQLIIFFMLVLDMSSAQIEVLTLPRADTAEKEEKGDPQTLIVNILKTGTIKIDGRTMWSEKTGNTEGEHADLIRLFQNRRNLQQYQEVPGSNTWVNYPVLIRMDGAAEFQHFQKILMIATMDGGVSQLQIAAKMPGGNE